MGDLSTPNSVQKLQTALHAKAKAEPGYRFYALYDKINREDILAHAYALCRSNKGAPGVDRQDFKAASDRWRMGDPIASQSPVSRRTLLLGCVAGGATALATSAGAATLQQSPVKVSKDSVDYVAVAQNGHRCSACKLYIAPSSCVAVSGVIGPDCSCRIWLPKAA